MTTESTSRLERIMEAGFATLADLQRETNERIDATNRRLDQTNERLDQTIVRLDQTIVRLDETNRRLGSLETRFDHFIETAGGVTRSLRGDPDALTARVERLEKRAS